MPIPMQQGSFVLPEARIATKQIEEENKRHLENWRNPIAAYYEYIKWENDRNA